MWQAITLEQYLALSKISGLGFQKLQVLMQHGISVDTLFSLSTMDLQALKLTTSLIQQIQQFSWQQIEPDLQWLQQQSNRHIITFSSVTYPALLKEIASPPLLLYIIGDDECLTTTQLAIVGSRKASPIGLENAYHFAQTFAAAGIVITSGMALGIDAASHRGALSVNGKTIAVLGAGFNHIYPKQHKRLAQEIIDTGALVSEFSPDMPPLAENFPRRNRIISGLSVGTLIVEANQRSGSLITARLAAEQGREVFALPGSIHNPLAKGCHELIKQGAKLVETSQDILEEVESLVNFNVLSKKQPTCAKNIDLDEESGTLLSCVDTNITTIDQIVRRSALHIEVVAAKLTQMELQGLVKSVAGGYVATMLKR